MVFDKIPSSKQAKLLNIYFITVEQLYKPVEINKNPEKVKNTINKQFAVKYTYIKKMLSLVQNCNQHH